MFVKLLGTLFLVLLIVAGVAYANGWISVQKSGDTATVEMKTGEMKEAAEQAVQEGKALFDKARNSLQNKTDGDRSPSEIDDNNG